MENNLKRLRKIAGLSLRDAAKGLTEQSLHLSLSHEALRRYENGEIGMNSERLIQFANFYKTSVDNILRKENGIKIEFGEIRWFKMPKYC